MRALAAIAIVVACAGVSRAQPRAAAFGFDHMLHDRNLIVRGDGALECTRCHVEKRGKLVGKPGHAACFGACHGPAPTAPRRGDKLAFGDRERVCTNCHAEAAQTPRYTTSPPTSYPPYTLDPDFNISFGHAQHAAVACALCHDLRDAKPARAAHSRCAGCHDGSKAAGRGPAMSACKGCHPQAVGKPEPPALATVTDSVTAVFSHATHAARGALGKDCATCHAAIRATDDTQLPRPNAATCATSACHDGKAAFAVTASCTRCHDRPAGKFEVARPTARFVHRGDHARAVETEPCITCHPLTTSGEVTVGGHSPCVACHAADFGAREPRICGACHNATEPWRALVADRAPPERTEFGATLDHAKHPGECSTCHVLRTATAELRPPRGHRACTGTACHAPTTGPAPRLETCSGCHRLGLAEARQRARANAPWSVRRAFDHGRHAERPGGRDVACRSCHDDLDGANVVELATPRKASCAPCHAPGKAAFKLTGTTCTRCHGGAR